MPVYRFYTWASTLAECEVEADTLEDAEREAREGFPHSWDVFEDTTTIRHSIIEQREGDDS